MDYKEKTVWITGAASGIGRALAVEYAKKQATVILSDRDKENLQATVKECEKLGTKAVYAPFDLAKADEIEKAVNDVLKIYPKINILISNGGISQRSYAIETPVEIDRKIFEINFFGAVTLTKALLPALIADGGGHISVTSSMTGKFGFPLRTAYCASKHAVQGYFEALRAELYDKNVKVTIVSPGRVYTNISINAIDKDGKAHGILDPGQTKGISAEKCARKIMKAIERNKKELWVGGSEILMIYIRKYMSPLFHVLARKINPT
ncbi:MAG: SDR family oxidoreductase [Bacteroidales bacterium]|nr:SDR family oxidoreductase [Bacteroidales bacterium]